MPRKEEFLKEAAELALKYRKICKDFENKKGNAPIECLQNILLDLAKCGGELVGFLRALAKADIFSEEDVKRLYNIAFSESDSFPKSETGFSPEITNFIKGLKDLDNLR